MGRSTGANYGGGESDGGTVTIRALRGSSPGQRQRRIAIVKVRLVIIVLPSRVTLPLVYEKYAAASFVLITGPRDSTPPW